MRRLYFYLNLFLCMKDDTELPMILLTDKNYFILFARWQNTDLSSVTKYTTSTMIVSSLVPFNTVQIQKMPICCKSILYDLEVLEMDF